MISKEDIRYKKGLENLKMLTERFNLQKGFVEIYEKGGRCASILTGENPDILKIVVDNFESIHKDVFVYYTIFQDTSFGPVVNMLYYNNIEDEWYLNDVDEDGWIYAATYNLELGDYGFEFGDIQLDSTDNGILYRKG